MRGFRSFKSSLPVVILLLSLLVAVSPSLAQDGEPPCLPEQGTLLTESIDSQALGQTKEYTLYLPPDWCNSADLPLLVMLHGIDGDNTTWSARGQIHTVADELILAGDIEPLIILMPDGDQSMYISGPAGDYETYIIDELVGLVDATYPTTSDRAQRSIGGLSMGGYGALTLGLRHADMFGAIGAHSPGIVSREELKYVPEEYAAMLGTIYGSDMTLFSEYDPYCLITCNGWPEDMRLFVDVGDADPLVGPSVQRFMTFLTEVAQIPHEEHIWPGVHNWDYWGAHTADYLRFYTGVEETTPAS